MLLHERLRRRPRPPADVWVLGHGQARSSAAGRHRLARPVRRGAGQARVSGPTELMRPRGIRRRDRRCGAGGAGGSRLRLIRGSACARRDHVDRRSGEVERTDPQLPGLPTRPHRPGAATRAYQQAWIFGTEFLLMRSACGCARRRGATSSRSTTPRSRRRASSSLWGSRTGGSASTRSSNSRAPACSTARRLQTHSSSRAAACSSSAAPTRPGRLPCTSAGMQRR